MSPAAGRASLGREAATALACLLCLRASGMLVALLLALSAQALTPPARRAPARSATRLLAQRFFVKTEQFNAPFPEVKPHLEAHRAWVRDLRAGGSTITSGYRVDSEGKPGGGGMLFFAAADYEDAEALVRQDPLIVAEVVTWRLNEWIAEVGGIELT